MFLGCIEGEHGLEMGSLFPFLSSSSYSSCYRIPYVMSPGGVLPFRVVLLNRFPIPFYIFPIYIYILLLLSFIYILFENLVSSKEIL